MSIPFIQKARIGSYILKKTLTGDQRFPLVLMLEPLFRCNLHCKGCGKVDHPKEVLDKSLSIEECVQAVEECGAPVVSIPGGEPLLHPDISRIVEELISRKKFVYLCTNGILVSKKIDNFHPSPYLNFSIHMDGLRERHDSIVSRDGVFDIAVDAIKLLLSRGFRVTTNTTFYGGETPENAAKLFDFLTSLGIEGMTVSAGFSYEKASDQDSFLCREETKALFRELMEMRKNRTWRFNHSELYLEFLAGRKDYSCAPWGNPTRSILGWQRPCYLLEEGFAPTYRDLMTATDWDRYGVGRDSRCAECMVHCGYEPSAVLDSIRHPLGILLTKIKQ